MSPRQSRAERRQAEWRAATAALEAQGHDPQTARRLLRARVGWRASRVPPIVAADPRQTEDRRQAERRADRTDEENRRILAQMGKEDQRRQQRRRGGDRRR